MPEDGNSHPWSCEMGQAMVWELGDLASCFDFTTHCVASGRFTSLILICEMDADTICLMVFSQGSQV